MHKVLPFLLCSFFVVVITMMISSCSYLTERLNDAYDKHYDSLVSVSINHSFGPIQFGIDSIDFLITKKAFLDSASINNSASYQFKGFTFDSIEGGFFEGKLVSLSLSGAPITHEKLVSQYNLLVEVLKQQWGIPESDIGIQLVSEIHNYTTATWRKGYFYGSIWIEEYNPFFRIHVYMERSDHKWKRKA